MSPHRRWLVALAALALAVALVLALALLGDRASGPLSQAFGRLATVVARLESGAAERLRGPGRRERLAWLAPYRADPSRLRAPDRILLGAYDGGIPASLSGALDLERVLATDFAFVHGYFAWGDKPDQRFPRDFVEAVAALGSIPVVTWEPWLSDFENRLHPHLPLRHERDRGGLAAIARGEYDFYVDAWAHEAASFGRPILLRFAHEMNDPYRYPWGPQNNHPFDFVAAWRHVIERFRAAGADNILWVWSPHFAYEGYEWFYPGEGVDWIAVGVLNYGTVARWSDWWSFAEIFGDRYEGLAVFDRPILIAEFGSLAVGGDRASWYREALRDLPHRYPLVRGVLFFAVERDATVTYQALDWTFMNDPDVVAALREAIAGWPRKELNRRPSE